jgi:hypothetical protein
MQFKVDVSFRAGALARITVGEPGAHGAGVIGTQGMGVSTPSAAVVAAATAGLAGQVHMPKGGMLTIGTWSRMLAAIIEPVTMGLGVALSMLGTRPKVQVIEALVQVCMGMVSLPCPQGR